MLKNYVTIYSFECTPSAYTIKILSLLIALEEHANYKVVQWRDVLSNLIKY